MAPRYAVERLNWFNVIGWKKTGHRVDKIYVVMCHTLIQSRTYSYTDLHKLSNIHFLTDCHFQPLAHSLISLFAHISLLQSMFEFPSHIHSSGQCLNPKSFTQYLTFQFIQWLKRFIPRFILSASHSLVLLWLDSSTQAGTHRFTCPLHSVWLIWPHTRTFFLKNHRFFDSFNRTPSLTFINSFNMPYVLPLTN